MSEVRFGWSATAQRYVNLSTGRFVSQDFVLNVMEERITTSFSRLEDMLVAVLDGGADIGVWQQAFATELRRMHTEMMALGRGGWVNVTQADWGRVGAKLREEYGFLQNFSQEIASSNLSEAQILARMRQYSDGAWSSYWKGTNASATDAGLTEEQRILDGGATHCDDCVGMAGHWEAINTLPAPGEDSQCGHRCRCTKIYR